MTAPPSSERPPPAIDRPVLHVLEAWGGGGTERYVAGLAAYLHGLGTASAVATLSGDPPAAAVVPHLVGRHAAGGAVGLGRLVRRTRPAVVHLHLYARLLPAALACRAAGAATLAHLHQPLTAWGARHRLGWRAAVRVVGRVTAGSTDTLRSAGFGPAAEAAGRAVRVPAPVAVPDPAPARPPADPGRPFTVVGVGRLSVEKDWPTLLRALPRVRDAARTGAGGRAVQFLHLGDGPRAGEFRALVRELNLEDVVEARGAVPHGEVAAALDAADLFVLPSRFEGLGIAPLEAMARGVPAVVADFPAAADYVVGPFGSGAETGHTFPRGDAAACAGRLLWHLRNPDESAAVGARGRALVADRFTPAATFGRLPPVYAALAGASAAARNSSTRSGGRNR